MDQTFFHLTFVVTFSVFTIIRMAYHRLAFKTRGKIEEREGRLHSGLRKGIGLPFILSLFVYMVRPDWFAWGSFSLPAWAQWIGVFLGVASLPLMWWIQVALGSNFSTTLSIRENHTLVTQGPYHWVRHPMYTVLFFVMVSMLLLTANWYIGGVPMAAFLLIVATRLPNEEAAMIEKFGDTYHAYMQRTGRFLPRWKGLSI